MAVFIGERLVKGAIPVLDLLEISKGACYPENKLLFIAQRIINVAVIIGKGIDQSLKCRVRIIFQLPPPIKPVKGTSCFGAWIPVKIAENSGNLVEDLFLDLLGFVIHLAL
jgi:hypothetical protein